MTTIQNTKDLLAFLEKEMEKRPDWFGWRQQKLTAIGLAHEIAARHADKMTPDQVVEYAMAVNTRIYHQIIKPQKV